VQPDRRPLIRPVRDREPQPNYVLRRIYAGGGLALVVGLVAYGLANAIGGSDDPVTDVVQGVSSADEETSASGFDPAAGPASVTDPVATDPVDVPIHHGFQEDVLYVALYGKVDTDRLGVLGERDAQGSADFAKQVSAGYRSFGRPVVPTFEIIASVASFEEGDGDYSNESPIAQLQPWLDVAEENEMHVVLDLQAGRESFDSQIREFEELLMQPHVGVALDPEWRVAPDEIPKGGQIGTVSGTEVNATIAYLDALVEANDLPPKMLIVHQFEVNMITEKDIIRGTDNVQVVIHMDGFGSLELKRGSYEIVTSSLPEGSLPGWKNFYDEDKPTPTPEETMAANPTPMFVSFQ
jgi:hypothetical protein